VVEVELDLVAGATDRLVTSELELLDEVLVGVLGHAATLIGVEEDVVNIERGSNERLGVSTGSLDTSCSKIGNSPQALINRAELDVDLDLVVLEGDQGESKTRVAAEPELERHVEGGLGESLAGSAHCGGGSVIARLVDLSERGIGDVCKLGGLANHLVVATLSLSGEGKLVPDVHPVTILAVNTLATNLDLNHVDELLSGVVEPASIRCIASGDLGESHLKVGLVGTVTVAGDCALNTAAEVSLSVEGVLNRLHREVRVASVSNLPESNLWLARQVDVLSTVSNKLH